MTLLFVSFAILSFLGMIVVPYVTDYVYFLFDDNASWLRASAGASVIVMACVVCLVRLIQFIA